MIISESKITHMGKTYFPIESQSIACTGCVFYNEFCRNITCRPDERLDNQEIIWIEIKKVSDNEVVLSDGSRYVVRHDTQSCRSCIFNKTILCYEVPCTPRQRQDRHSVIFIEDNQNDNSNKRKQNNSLRKNLHT